MLTCALGFAHFTSTLSGQAIRFGLSKMKTGKGAVAGSEETLSTTELDNGIFAKVPLKAGERMLYDAATAVEFPIHIYSRMWELQELTNLAYRG